MDLARVSPTKRARLGIVHVPEGRGLFYGLTVTEHFRLGYRGERPDENAAYEYFPKLQSCALGGSACYRAASSRCSRWRAASPAGLACFSSTSSLGLAR